MNERTMRPRAHTIGQDVAFTAEKNHQRLRDDRQRSLTTFGGERNVHEMLELAFRLEQARETISHLEEVIASLQEHCITDPLTGVYNRKGAEERLAEDVARTSLGSGSLTLAVLDADNLKEINDRWGHQAGDVFLRHLANTLERNVREEDWLARWGGDEFVVVFWDAEVRTEGMILRRMGEDLQRNPVRLAQGEEAVRISFSAGVCRHSGEGAGELFARADAALLEAKREGRGAIVEAS